MATIPSPPVDVHGAIPEPAAKKAMATGLWDNPEVLKIVIQDAERAENFEATKSWVMQWPTATVLYQSPFAARYWEGTQTERANIPFYTVATAVESLVPQIINGLFYEETPFMVQKHPKTSADTARAVQAILGYQLKDINFQRELRYGIKNAVLFGTAIWKWGWESYTRSRMRYHRVSRDPQAKNRTGLPPIQITEVNPDIEEEVIEETIERPTFENIVSLRHVLVDPGCNKPDIREAKYVVHRMYLTWKELDKLRDRPGFNIPSKEQLLSYFLPPQEPVEEALGEVSIRNALWDARATPRFDETTADIFEKPLEVLERWDKDHYMVVLQKKLVLCNDKNPYGEIPFLSCGWWDVPEAFWSMGVAKTIGSEQRLQQGVTNTWLDGVSLNLNGVYVRVRGKSAPTQSIRISPGRIVDVDNKGDFEPLDRLPSVPEAPAALQMSQARAESYSGANELITQGSLGGGGRSSITRTAAGANLLANGTGSRIGDWVTKLCDQVFIPFLYHAHEMNSALLPESTIRQILDEELTTAYDEDLINILNARLKFNISAGAKMQARRNMAQALPILVQFLMSPQTGQGLGVEGKKVKVDEILKMFFEVSDWKTYNDVVVPMTPQEDQRWQMTTPAGAAAAQSRAKSQLMGQKFQQDQDLLDQSNIARAGREVLRQAMEQSAIPEEVQGQAGGTGFGSNV